MRYIDTGSRDPAQALGAWFQDNLTHEISEVHWQTGFFEADGLGILAPTLQRLAASDQPVKALIGSNGAMTLRDDVLQLLTLLGAPRAHGELGVISYSGGFFHPKTYHLRRGDESQCAYVGSANLTSPGIASLHIEAGVVLDTRDGDSVDLLNRVASVIDEWFTTNRDGFHLVADPGAVDQLVANGVLAAAAAPRPPGGTSTGAGATTAPTQPRLQPLIRLPRLPSQSGAAPPSPQTPTPALTGNLAVPRPGFPSYLLFAPNATAQPTRGLLALSGAQLPSGAVGIVIRLNRDSARHFSGRPGTANISVPVATATTLRFGIFPGRYLRPRAVYDLLIRYQSHSNAFVLPPAQTNVMAYGFLAGESGHGDLRMVVPAAVKTLADRVRRAGLPVPVDGDVALLEWPSAAAPQFRLTFMERHSPLFQRARELFENASAADQLVGEGACWLPAGISPPW